MNRLIGLIVAVFIACTAVLACQDEYVTVEKLPVAANEFVKEYFAGQSVSYIKQDRDGLSKNYEVYFESGDKVEFDRNGQWKEISKYTGISSKLLPPAVKTYLDRHHKGAVVVKLEKQARSRYEVTLASGLELTLTSAGKLVEID